MQKKIMLLGTGGTISGRASSAVSNVDYRAGEVSVAELFASVPNGQKYVDRIEFEQIAQLDSKDMSWLVMTSLALRIAELTDLPEVQGVVITHGTDTLEETAFFLHLVSTSSKPVVLTCAMRPATSLLADGPTNLSDALAVATHPDASGVLVVCAGRIHSATNVQKEHPYKLDAFGSGEAGCVGFVEEGRVRFVSSLPTQLVGEARELLEKLNKNQALDEKAWPRVEVLMNFAGATSLAVDALVAHGVDGVIIAGTGNGTVHHRLEAALVSAQNSGVVVALTTRCASGRIIPVSSAKFQYAEGLSPVKARIAMVLRRLGEQQRRADEIHPEQVAFFAQANKGL